MNVSLNTQLQKLVTHFQTFFQNVLKGSNNTVNVTSYKKKYIVQI